MTRRRRGHGQTERERAIDVEGDRPEPRSYRNRDKPGATRRGVPADYAGGDPGLCNARTKTGRPCRAAALAHGRCKWHGGLSTGPKTAEGKAKAMLNLAKANAALARLKRIKEAVRDGGANVVKC
jgi:hypothetical protein